MLNDRLKRGIGWLLLAGLIITFPVSTVTAQEYPISISAEAGFDSYYKQNEWTPVRVTVSNNGPDVDGLIVIEQSSTSSGEKVRYQAPVSLPGQSRKTVTLYIGVDGYQSNVKVKLMDGERTLAETKQRMEMVGYQDYLYAIASGQLVDMAFLEAVAPAGLNAEVAYITLDELPAESAAWSGLDLLILNDVDTGTLNPDQLEAMQDWLGNGGRLVVTGGPNWLKTSAGIRDLLPVEVQGGITVYDLGALEAYGSGAHPLDDGKYPAAQARVIDGHTLLQQDDLVLLAQRKVGLGTVDWLALDLALAPLRDWTGNESMWQFIVDGMNSRSTWSDSTINEWSARDGLKSIPSLALPSTMQMVLFLLIYTLLIGPVNYIVLRRMKKTEMAWMTIPVLILVFSGLAYATGFKQRGSEVVFNRLSLVYGAAESGQARAQTLLGVFSPSRETLDVVFPEGVMVRPLVLSGSGSGFSPDGAAIVEQSGRVILRDVRVDVGAIRAFRAEATVASPEIDCQLWVDITGQPSLVGSVTNRGSFLLENAGIMLGDNVFALGDLAPGQTVSVDEVLGLGRATVTSNYGVLSGAYSSRMAMPYTINFSMDTLVGGTNYWSDKKLNRRYQIIQAMIMNDSSSSNSQSAIFFAWSEQPVWNVQAEGKEAQSVDTVGYFLESPISFSTLDDRLVIPPALTTWGLLGNQWVGETGPYDMYISNGWASFEYRPWEPFLGAEITELIVTMGDASLAAPSSGQSIKLSMWDWEQDAWIVNSNIGWGENRIVDLENLIGPNNAVRLKVENSTNYGVSVNRLDVTYIGSEIQLESEGDAS
ncbi:MAG: hypothetical protein JXA42_09115 [Anaerolineales bacterium]|nr:hypothetical protein [Anaerolineales bacterium]